MVAPALIMQRGALASPTSSLAGDDETQFHTPPRAGFSFEGSSMNIMDSVKTQQTGVQLGGAVYASSVPEVGMIERAAGIANGLQSLHDKIGSIRDKIEGNSQASGKPCAPVSGGGLRGHITEAESVLRACHSLLDDIAGKF